jgi:flagellar basal-body rod protein FlgB
MEGIKSDLKLMASGDKRASDDDHFWETALRLRTQQLQLIASNIANADTPNYKAVDIDFKSALDQALSSRESADVTKSSPQHMSAQSTLSASVLYRTPLQPSVDGNTVDMDVERAAFAQNSVMYEFTLQHAVGEYKDMIDLFKSLVP